MIQISIIAVIAVAELFALQYGRKFAFRTDQDINKCIDQIEIMIKNNNIALTRPTLARFEAYQDYSKESYEKILSMLASHQDSSREVSPLEFKEELLRIQKLLSERATLWDINIPNAISFGEYDGGNIPHEKDVASLKIQLTVVRALVNYLIESRIVQLNDIKRLEPRPISITGKETMYEIYPFQISFDANIENLLTFLTKVHMSRELVIVRKINIDAQGDTRLSINIELDYIRFKTE